MCKAPSVFFCSGRNMIRKPRPLLSGRKQLSLRGGGMLLKKKRSSYGSDLFCQLFSRFWRRNHFLGCRAVRWDVLLKVIRAKCARREKWVCAACCGLTTRDLTVCMSTRRSLNYRLLDLWKCPSWIFFFTAFPLKVTNSCAMPLRPLLSVDPHSWCCFSSLWLLPVGLCEHFRESSN